MEGGGSVLNVVLWLIACLQLSLQAPFSLQYLYNVITLEFTAVVLVNGEQIVYYNKKMIPKTEWIRKLEAEDPEFWMRETLRMQNQQDWFQDNLVTAMKSFNQTKGVHTLQRMYGCELHDDGTTGGLDQFGYDGEDFISLDLKTGTWTAANDPAEIFIKTWDPKGRQAKYWKNLLETDCTEWLQKFVFYGRETLQREVPPETSLFQRHLSSPEVVCHATGFFPKALNISWQKDGEDVYENVQLGETLPNQDGSFQKRSVLKVSVEDVQKHTYTCVIQHSSLEKDLVLPVSERRILRDGGSDGGSHGTLTGIIVVVVVALAVLAVGIFVMKKKHGFRPVTVLTMQDSSSPPGGDIAGPSEVIS